MGRFTWIYGAHSASIRYPEAGAKTATVVAIRMTRERNQGPADYRL